MFYLLSQLTGMIESFTGLYETIGESTPLVYIIVPSLLGVILFFATRKSENKMVTLLPYLPLIIGVILGIVAYILMTDTLYMSIYLQGRPKKTILMRAVPIVPILTAIGIFFLSRKSEVRIGDNL